MTTVSASHEINTRCGHIWVMLLLGINCFVLLVSEVPVKGKKSFLIKHLTHFVPQNEALVPRKLYCRCLGKHGKTETSFKTNFLPMKRENSITSYCIVLTFKSAKIWWLVKEILVSEALGINFLWTLIASIKIMTQTMDECLILNKLGSWTVKLCQTAKATLQC